MPKHGLTNFELAQLRLRCADVAMTSMMKADMSRNMFADHAEKIWEFVMKPLTEKAGDHAE